MQGPGVSHWLGDSGQACLMLSPRVTHVPSSHWGGAGVWEALSGQ